MFWKPLIIAAACGIAVAPLQSTCAATQLSARQASIPGYGQARPDRRDETQRLMDAAQALRDATSELASQPAGPRREAAIKAAQQALANAQNAMVIEHLQDASERLQDSVRQMAEAPPGPSRDLAIEEAGEALRDARQAVMDLPVTGPHS